MMRRDPDALVVRGQADAPVALRRVDPSYGDILRAQSHKRGTLSESYSGARRQAYDDRVSRQEALQGRQTQTVIAPADVTPGVTPADTPPTPADTPPIGGGGGGGGGSVTEEVQWVAAPTGFPWWQLAAAAVVVAGGAYLLTRGR